MHWRLGLDVGTNSLGWWAFRVSREGTGAQARWQPVESLDGGVYIFPDGREPSKNGRVGDGKAVARRMARGLRRNRDHGKNRIRCLVHELIALKLLPEDPKEREKYFKTPKKTPPQTDRFNPYRLRSEALERPLQPYELGRALLHLGLRRGYKSNRKEASDTDGGKLKERIESLKATLQGKTLGQYLWHAYLADYEREQQWAKGDKSGAPRKGIRFRAEDAFFPDRSMYAEEFDAIRKIQAPHHTLSDADWERLRDNYILFQWPLRAVKRGKCEFYPSAPRHWKDTPIAHDFRIYQELNALRWIDSDLVSHPLDAEQRAKVLEKLLHQVSEVKFKSLRKLKRQDKTPLFPADSRFNLESENRKGLKPHKIAAVMTAKDSILAPLWEQRMRDQDGRLDDMFEVLHTAEDDAEARSTLMSQFGLDEATARALVAIPLSSGTASVSRRFMDQIVPILADQGLVYSDAVKQLTDENGNPLHHSLRDDGQRWDRLPYYGAVLSGSTLGAEPSADPQKYPEKHYGKINNPTVHVALNSLRRVVNTLVDRFGTPPVEVHIELTRDLKLSRQKRDEITARQRANKKENDRIKKFCAEHGIHDPSARDIKKVKLWEELGQNQLARCCVFSGQPISAAQLFNGEAEIEHILPFSRTLDDSLSNLTISMRWANRLKGNKTPYEAFHNNQHADQGIAWEDILHRARALPAPKRKRFSPNAMDLFEQEGGFIARQLTDTAYVARAATRYVKALKGVEHVRANPGRLTAMVRRKWGLNGILNDDNQKTRDDHRHHAIDAAVVGLIDSSVLNAASRLTARGADDLIEITLPELDNTLRDAIRNRVPNIITAFKPDHGLQGRMFNDTAYGDVPEDARDRDFPHHNLVARKALTDLTPTECQAIRDPQLRQKVRDYLHEAQAVGVKHETALSELAKETGIKRVRILVKNQASIRIPSAPYKNYTPGSYAFCDIWEIPPKKNNKKPAPPKWEGVFWSYAETTKKAADNRPPDKALKKPHPAARFVTRLFKNDLIACEDGGQTRIMRVAGFSTTNNKLDVRPHALADGPQQHVSLNTLREQGLRKLYVTPDGRILESKRKGAT